MGAPAPELNSDNAADDSAAQGFVSSLRTISAGERRKHASVYNYWMSIRRDREFPPIRDLDPLELSDAAPYSVLLEMVGGGEDAGIRHVGQAIKGGLTVEKLSDAPNPSLLSCIASRLPVVAACRDAFAFEDEFETADGKTRCWISLLPFSATGTWIDYVYGFVSLDSPSPAADTEMEATQDEVEECLAVEEIEPVADMAEAAEEPVEVARDELVDEVAEEVEPEKPELEAEADLDPIPEFLRAPQAVSSEQTAEALKPSFSEKFFEKLSNIGGFYGRPVEIELDPDTVSLETWDAEAPQDVGEADELTGVDELDPVDELVTEDEPASVEELVAEEELAPVEELVAEEELASIEELVAQDEPAPADELTAEDDPAPAEEPTMAEEPPSSTELNEIAEGTLESKLTEVRAKADEARQAKLRANAALYEGLSAAYDFALDAEDAPEEYLKLVQAEGLKIQLRSPMKPVAKLAFEGMCDEMTIKQLEAILAWAFEEELPRGKLAERIEEEGGIAPILNRQAKAA